MIATTLWLHAFNGFTLSLLFEKRDLWIGIFWEKLPLTNPHVSHRIYVCFVPCFPFLISIWRKHDAPRVSKKG